MNGSGEDLDDPDGMAVPQEPDKGNHLLFTTVSVNQYLFVPMQWLLFKIYPWFTGSQWLLYTTEPTEDKLKCIQEL